MIGALDGAARVAGWLVMLGVWALGFVAGAVALADYAGLGVNADGAWSLVSDAALVMLAAVLVRRLAWSIGDELHRQAA